MISIFLSAAAAATALPLLTVAAMRALEHAADRTRAAEALTPDPALTATGAAENALAARVVGAGELAAGGTGEVMAAGSQADTPQCGR